MRTHILNHFHTFHPEAQAEFDRLAAEEKRLTLAIARRGESDEPVRQRMSEPPVDIDGQLADVRARMDAQRDIIKSGVVRLHLKALTRGEYRRLLSEHGPRDGDDLDKRLGYNADTFGEALIAACLIRTDDLDGEPVDNDWSTWADEMTNGQWQETLEACLRLTNAGQPDLPR